MSRLRAPSVVWMTNEEFQTVSLRRQCVSDTICRLSLASSYDLLLTSVKYNRKHGNEMKLFILVSNVEATWFFLTFNLSTTYYSSIH